MPEARSNAFARPSDTVQTQAAVVLEASNSTGFEAVSKQHPDNPPAWPANRLFGPSSHQLRAAGLLSLPRRGAPSRPQRARRGSGAAAGAGPGAAPGGAAAASEQPARQGSIESGMAFRQQPMSDSESDGSTGARQQEQFVGGRSCGGSQGAGRPNTRSGTRQPQPLQEREQQQRRRLQPGSGAGPGGAAARAAQPLLQAAVPAVPARCGAAAATASPHVAASREAGASPAARPRRRRSGRVQQQQQQQQQQGSDPPEGGQQGQPQAAAAFGRLVQQLGQRQDARGSPAPADGRSGEREAQGTLVRGASPAAGVHLRRVRGQQQQQGQQQEQNPQEQGQGPHQEQQQVEQQQQQQQQQQRQLGGLGEAGVTEQGGIARLLANMWQTFVNRSGRSSDGL
ncbi:hypothetical protein N2152v2_003693 [Parachlorella kessleri]